MVLRPRDIRLCFALGLALLASLFAWAFLAVPVLPRAGQAAATATPPGPGAVVVRALACPAAAAATPGADRDAFVAVCANPLPELLLELRDQNGPRTRETGADGWTTSAWTFLIPPIILSEWEAPAGAEHDALAGYELVAVFCAADGEWTTAQLSDGELRLESLPADGLVCEWYYAPILPTSTATATLTATATSTATSTATPSATPLQPATSTATATATHTAIPTDIPPPEPTDAPEPTPRPTDDVDGGLAVYESPTYGYALAYDPEEWEVVEEDDDPDDDFDYLVVSNGRSAIILASDSTHDEDELDACLDDSVAAILEDDDNITDVEPLDRRDAEGEEDGRAWATYTYTDDAENEEYTNYFECRWLDGGVMVIVIHLVPTDDYEDEIEAREVFLDGIADLEVYESPLYGYTISYDPEEWEVIEEDDDPDDEYDLVVFSNGPSVIAVWGDPDYEEGEMATCLADYVRGFEDNDELSDIEPLDERDAEGEEDGRAWATYAYADEAEDEFIRYFECRYVGDGMTIAVIHYVASDEYDDEVEAREEVLEGFDPSDGGEGDEGEEQEVEGEENDFEVWESATYGFTLLYDSGIWQIDSDESSEDGDQVRFSNGVSFVTLSAIDDFDGEPRACLDAWEETLGDSPSVDDFAQFEDEDGDPIVDEGEGFAHAVWSFTSDDGDDKILDVECRVLIDDQATLTILLETFQDQYAAQVAAKYELLDGLDLTGRSRRLDQGDREARPQAALFGQAHRGRRPRRVRATRRRRGSP